MEYKTKSGHVLTDVAVEELGDACERGEYPGKAGRIIVAPVGRPQLYPSDELVTVAFKIPRSYRDKLDIEAKKKKETRSGLLRGILGDVLP
jgi:hypothetical protein